MEKTETQIKILNIIKHPIIGENLAILRDKNADGKAFREATKKIAQILLYEATKNLPTCQKEIFTPLENTFENVISKDINIIISPILRAGLIFEDTALKFLPMAKTFHIGLYRNEKTLEPVWYYNKLPEKIKNPEKNYVFITDPMLATGGSLLDAIKLYTDKGIPENNINAVCIIAAPEGVKKVYSHFPNVKITVASLDRTLNEKGYILPGLGDAGDRIFNTL